MPLTYGDLSAEVQHVLGGRPSTKSTQTVASRTARIVNDAGRALFARPWRFREASTTASTVASQEYVACTASVAQVVAAWLDTVPVSLVAPIAIEEARATSCASYTPIACLRVSSGLLRVELYPTPSSVQTLRMLYRTRWPSVEADTPAETAIDVPDYAEQALIEYVRAVAESYEDGTAGVGLTQRFAAIEQGPAFRSLVVADSEIQGSYGSLMDMTRVQWPRPALTVEDPS
jgi:hypothetical protein